MVAESLLDHVDDVHGGLIGWEDMRRGNILRPTGAKCLAVLPVEVPLPAGRFLVLRQEYIVFLSHVPIEQLKEKGSSAGGVLPELFNAAVEVAIRPDLQLNSQRQMAIRLCFSKSLKNSLVRKLLSIKPSWLIIMVGSIITLQQTPAIIRSLCFMRERKLLPVLLR